jgi:hypothetical protein
MLNSPAICPKFVGWRIGVDYPEGQFAVLNAGIMAQSAGFGFSAKKIQINR